jgi:hypothetical protein
VGLSPWEPTPRRLPPCRINLRQEAAARQVVPPIGWGLAVHQARRPACWRHGNDAGPGPPEWRAWGPLYAALLALRDGLGAHHGPSVAMASTGVSWQPISHGLVGVGEGLVGHAGARRPRPGPQTAPAEARWMAELVAHGLIRPSCVPPAEPRALRDLTRTRVGLVQTRTLAQNRLQQVLEASNSKRSRGVSDVLGTRGRQRLTALSEGEREAPQGAALARGRLRRTLPALALA